MMIRCKQFAKISNFDELTNFSGQLFSKGSEYSDYSDECKRHLIKTLLFFLYFAPLALPLHHYLKLHDKNLWHKKMFSRRL